MPSPAVRIRMEELADALGSSVEAIGPALGKAVAAGRWGVEADGSGGWIVAIPRAGVRRLGLARHEGKWMIERSGLTGVPEDPGAEDFVGGAVAHLPDSFQQAGQQARELVGIIGHGDDLAGRIK